MSCDVITTERVRSLLVAIRGQMVLLDRDVAALYEVQTKEVNQAVRNNPEKFPAGFVFQLNSLELEDWKSKILTSNLSEEKLSSVKMGVRKLPYAFTERGLYMLATILKGRAATRATLAIVDFALVKIRRRYVSTVPPACSGRRARFKRTEKRRRSEYGIMCTV